MHNALCAMQQLQSAGAKGTIRYNSRPLHGSSQRALWRRCITYPLFGPRRSRSHEDVRPSPATHRPPTDQKTYAAPTTSQAVHQMVCQQQHPLHSVCMDDLPNAARMSKLPVAAAISALNQDLEMREAPDNVLQLLCRAPSTSDIQPAQDRGHARQADASA